MPEATAPQTQFRIMQRATPSAGETENSSRATSVSGEDNGTESSGPRGKTLEERTLAYALARKRIIGEGLEDDAASSTSAGGFARSRQHSRYGEEEDDMDMMPRRAYPPDMEYVYPSLYPPGDNQGNPGLAQGIPIPQNAPYGYAPMQGGPYQGYMPQGMGYPPNDGRVYMAPYQHMPQQAYGAQMQIGGYPQGWQQPPPMQPGPPPGMMGGGQMAGMMMAPVGQGWYPPDMGMPQPPSSMMPMIPQGMPYAPTYPHPQPQPGPTLVQPTPMRHDRHPLSSTSSSISSRSYQDMNSRPHSRGSTTSTRSAASSVRLGAMYPVGGQAPVYGYRQKAVKVASSSATVAPGVGATTEGRRNGRQSPVSCFAPAASTDTQASTTSSRSSRRASSIQITQPLPGQHPLPQRPDWAANNVPYHPSPLPPPGHTDASTSDFPPLNRGSATNAAEPMQIEKVKMRPSASAWNGAARQPHPHPQVVPEPTPQPQSPLTPHAAPTISLFPNPISPKASTPVAPVVHVEVEADPDFPRRIPSARTPALYDPSAPARTARVSPAPAPAHTPLAEQVVTDEVIEARIAALNIKGVSIGPPSATRQPPSYAKIVRRD